MWTVRSVRYASEIAHCSADLPQISGITVVEGDRKS